MLNLIGAAAGGALGAFVAWRRNGNAADIAQYAAVFLIIGFLLGTLLMLVVPSP